MSDKLTLERSWETNALVEFLLALEPGQVATYDQLSEACGQSVRGEARHKLVSALLILERDHAVLFDAVRGTGYQRCTPVGVVAKATGAIKRIHRTAKRGMSRAETISDSERLGLAEPDRLRLDTGKTMLVQLARSTTHHVQKRISNGGEASFTYALPKVS